MIGSSAEGRAHRRIYIRQYMRAWRERNREHCRTYGREYQRKNAVREKLQRMKREDRAGPTPEVKRCHYCRAIATEMTERINPRTLEAMVVPYCGHC